MGARQGLAGLAGSYKPTTPADWTDPPPETIADALDELAAGGSTAGAGAPSLLWTSDPALVAGGNVFKTWASLAVELKKIKGLKFIATDTAHGALHITPGAWSGISDLYFVAAGSIAAQSTVIVDDGATLPDCRALASDSVDFFYAGTTGPCLPTTGIVVVNLTNFGAVFVTGGKPFVSMAAGAALASFVDGGATWGTGSFAATGTGLLTVVLKSLGKIAANAASGTGTLSVLMTADAICDVNQTITTFALEVDATQISLLNLGGISDGVTDNAATFQAAVNILAGSGVALVVNGSGAQDTYLVSQPVKFPASTSAALKGFTIIGDPNTTIKSTVASATVEDAPLVGVATLGAFSTSLAANNVVGTSTLSMTAAPTVGMRVLINSGDTPFNSAAYFVRNVAGLGPFTVTVDRPVLRQFVAAGSGVSELASWPQQIRVQGNGLRITGTGTRWLQLEAGLNCEVGNLVFDTSAGHPTDAFSISMDVSCEDCIYSDFTVTDSTAVASNSSIVMESAENCHFLRCVARGSAAPILLLDSMVCDVTQCEGSTGLAAAGFGILLASDGASYGCRQCTIRGGTYGGSRGAGGIGVMLRDGTSDCAVLDVDAPGNSVGFELDAAAGATKNNLFTNCTATDCTTQAMLIAQAVRGTIVQGFNMSRSAALRSNDECILQGITGRDLPAAGGVNLSQGTSTPVCVLDGFLLESTAAAFTGVIANTGKRAIVKNGRVTLNAAPGTTQVAYSLSTGVLDLSSVVGDGTNVGGAASFGIHSSAGTTLRLGPDVDVSTLDQPLGDVNGYCTKNLGVVAQNNPIVANNAVAVDVTWPDLKSTDRVSLTLITKGGAPSAMPQISYTPGTKFTLTSFAGDTSTYGYTIN